MNECEFTPTNTLTSATFDILKMDAIDDPTISMSSLAKMDFEESYFSTTIDFIREQNTSYTNIKKKLYGAIYEAADETAVLESFSDFFSAVRDIIDKFLKFMKSLFQRFWNHLMQLIGSERYLMQHKKDLDNFKPGDKFYMPGYKYTFNENVPITETGIDFDSNLFDELTGKLGSLGIDAFKNARTAINLELKADEFRGQVIGKSEPISETDFPDELFRIFRDDEYDKDEIEVDYMYVRTAKNRYFDYKKEKSRVEKYQRNLEKEYKTIEKQVKEIYSRENGGINITAFTKRLTDIHGSGIKFSPDQGLMSPEMLTAVDLYYKAKVDQVQEFSNIHAIAFAAKLDAMKDCYKQDKATLYGALSRILRTDAQRERSEY